jgi:translation elongation factor EF-4
MFITVTNERKINSNKIDEMRYNSKTKTITFFLCTGEIIINTYDDIDSFNNAYRLFDSEIHQTAYAVDRLVAELEEIKFYGIKTC